MGHLGCSYTGLVFLLMLAIPYLAEWPAGGLKCFFFLNSPDRSLYRV